MNVAVPAQMIAVIKAERDRRAARLRDADPDLATDEWQFLDEPFINELSLVLLVAIRHQVERELLCLVAREGAPGQELEQAQYRERLRREREALRKKDGWQRLADRLSLGNHPDWISSMETLRLLANCFKHDPLGSPDRELLVHLKLDVTCNYAPLPQSDGLREALALSLCLDKDADYCVITEEFLARADQLMRAVEAQPMIAPVKPGYASFDPEDFLC